MGTMANFVKKTCPGRCSGKNGVCQADGKVNVSLDLLAPLVITLLLLLRLTIVV